MFYSVMCKLMFDAGPDIQSTDLGGASRKHEDVQKPAGDVAL